MFRGFLLSGLCFAASRRTAENAGLKRWRDAMLGMKVWNTDDGEVGIVDAVAIDGAGRAMVRVNDRWFEADRVVGA